MLPGAPSAVKSPGYVSLEMGDFPVIVGPTAGGKSSVAMALASRLADRGVSAEIISADAFQVYRGMDIGTAKPAPADRAAVPHHAIDIRDPTEAFTVDEWLAIAEEQIQRVRSAGGIPIVVGGTHFYVKALLEGLFEGPTPDPELRASLQAIDASSLRAELEQIDPKAAERIHPNDRRRTIRAIEVHRQTGIPISEHQKQWDAARRDDAILVALQWPVEQINSRINSRVRDMITAGLVEEAHGLWEAGGFGPQSREAIGYRQFIAHFEGQSTQEEAVEAIKIETRRFAKSQRTWIRRLLAGPPGAPSPISVDASSLTPEKIAQAIESQLVNK